MMGVASGGLRHQLHSSARSLYGSPFVQRPCPQLNFSARLRMRNVRPTFARPVQILSSSKNSKNMEGMLASQLLWSASWKDLSSVRTFASVNSGGTDSSSGDVKLNEKKKDSGNFVAKMIKSFVKAIGALAVMAILLAAALPSLLSWSSGRKTALSLANVAIPGSINVSSVSLGWTRPVLVEGFALQGDDGQDIITIPRVETKAPLWSILMRKSGLGDCTVTSPVIDLQQHPENKLPRIALAVTSAETLLQNKPLTEKQLKQKIPPPAEASLTADVKFPKGGFKITDGKIILPSDVASILGDRLVVDVGVGQWAIKESEDLKNAQDKNDGIPLLVTAWSETLQAQVAGFVLKDLNKLKLIKPLSAEMDLTPEVAKFYLARINPLLGEVIGPAIQDEDMPDVMLTITPTNMELPADHYTVNLAPMKVTLARGQVVEGVLSLLSKQELVKGKRNLTMQTSYIQAKLDMPSTVQSSRLDILIADSVHVATWGRVDWIEETVQMTLAIPGNTLKDILGLTKIPPTYYLQIPVAGTLEKPVVDWRKAGVGIAELTARQRGGQFLQGILDMFESKETAKSKVPKPIDVLPWETSGTQ